MIDMHSLPTQFTDQSCGLSVLVCCVGVGGDFALPFLARLPLLTFNKFHSSLTTTK